MGAAKQRQAVAPYALPLAIAYELSGMIDDRQSHLTGTYLGMAQVGANNSGTGAILDYEVPYVDPRCMFILQSILY